MNRSYNSGLGRFTQVDPIGMGAASPGDPQSLNLYAYCQNDPINRLDADGLDGGASLAIFIVTAILGAIRASLSGGSRARTAPIVQKVTFRETAEVSNRSVWTDVGIQAGAGAVVVFVNQNQNKKTKRPTLKKKGEAKAGTPDKVDSSFGARELFELFLTLAAVAFALKDPTCASIFGGVSNAQSVISGVKLRDLNSRNPEFNKFPKGVRDQANGKLAGVTPVGGKDVYLTSRFHSMNKIFAKAIVFIHELKHVNKSKAEPDGYDYQKDYDEISTKCRFGKISINK